MFKLISSVLCMKTCTRESAKIHLSSGQELVANQRHENNKIYNKVQKHSIEKQKEHIVIRVSSCLPKGCHIVT